MPNPDNLSLGGIIRWSEQNPGQRTDPGPEDQNINADMVDGMHYNDLKSEWEAYASSAGGGGVVAFGSSWNFAGNGASTTVTIGTTLSTLDYIVCIIPSESTNSKVGEYYVPESGKTTSTFDVVNEGSGQTTFSWAILLSGNS